MATKTKSNIATWVATAVGETSQIDGAESAVTVTARYVSNAGDYEQLLVRSDGLRIPVDERFSASVEDQEIQFMALEDRGHGEYLLRVKVD